MSARRVGDEGAKPAGRVGVLVGGLVCIAGLAVAGASEPVTPNADLAARGQGLVLARCGVCHSTDLIDQQRLPQSKWDATVSKMRHWGADLTDEEAQILIAYLSTRYHPDAPEVLPPDHEPGEPFRVDEPAGVTAVDRPVGHARRGSHLFSTNCQACHGLKAVGGAGPKLAGNAILRDADRFWDTVSHGRNAMPAWGAILKAQDIADIHAWLQSLAE